MKQYSVPICYFPSTVYFIDDSKDFLLNFVLQLDEGLAYRLFDSPLDALDNIDHSRNELSQLKVRCAAKHPEELTSLRHPALSYALSPLYAEIHYPSRFADVSVVVIDYMMPGMTGIDFCRRISNTSIKKILLTGEADESVAIEAFNEGIIDRYIKKSDPEVVELITNNIAELQQEYFQSLSDRIISMLPTSTPAFMKDRNFYQFFQSVCQQHNIVEYYLINPEGYFILFDADSKASLLLIKQKQMLKNDVELSASLSLSKEEHQAIAKGELILLSNGAISGDYQLYPAQRFVSDTPLYYSYIETPEISGISNGDLFSYNQYMDELDAEALGAGKKESLSVL